MMINPAAILYYDYLLTLSWEVERVWKTSGLNWGAGLFYLNRYVGLLGHIPVIFEYFWSTSNPRKYDVSESIMVCPQFASKANVLDVSEFPITIEKASAVFLSLHQVVIIWRHFIDVLQLRFKL